MAKFTLDTTDRKILKFLIKNARTPFLEIARECGISGAAIHQRIHKLEEAGVILGSRLVVDPKILGFDVCAFINIRIKDSSLQKPTVDKLRQIPEIVECHHITGTYNLMVKAYCIDNDHLMKVLDTILSMPGTSTETFLSLKESLQRQIYVDCLED